MLKPVCRMIIPTLAEFAITCPAELDLQNKLGFLQNDSRAIRQDDIFCAVIGHSLDGRKYIDQAIKNGASLVLSECEQANQHGAISWLAKDKTVAVIQFYQLNQKLFPLAKAYYQSPQDTMSLVGLTGTNGKTSTSQLIAQMISALAKSSANNAMSCAVIGTNGAGAIESLKPLANTTPSALELHQLFYQFKQQSFTHIAMEVSSHALEQARVNGELFDIALFTNLSRDHLDYHGTMADYAAAKRKLFVDNNKQIAVVNFDDQQAKLWLQDWPVKQNIWLYGRDSDVSLNKQYLYAKEVKHHSRGVDFVLVSHLGEVVINSPLLGDFNIDNLLAAIAVLLIDGATDSTTGLADIAKAIALLKPIAGRMEASSANNLPTAVVDYAHTPDALEKALIACKEHCSGKLYVVFGCGGDRDKGKRPLMAQAAEKYADQLVMTNDNPRTESADDIVADMKAGIATIANERLEVILDRKQAVLTTLAKADVDDIVLLAGKGHEDYIILGTEKIDYNEREIVAKFYQQHSQGEVVNESEITS